MKNVRARNNSKADLVEKYKRVEDGRLTLVDVSSCAELQRSVSC
jgi:hypothetical protein